MSGSDVRVGMDILVADDDPKVTSSVGKFLKARGHRVHEAEDGVAAVEILQREAIDIVITDLKMPGMDGFEVLREARRLSPDAEVILITGYDDAESAFRAMREGAFDFFSKPFKVEELNASVQRTVRFQTLQRDRKRSQERLDRIGAEARQRYGLSEIIGESPGIREVKEQIRKVCQAEVTTVLVCGETGTGKDLVARAIHYESARASAPFVAVDCTSIPESLIESAFYGHEKGAFTDAQETHKGYFEQADGGTLFLDEIGDMDIGMQVKLLRTLEERSIRRVGGSREIPVDVRVISATNRDLPQAVNEGRFREDLFYRLNVFAIQVPTLRERPEDILPLARYFLEGYAREMRKPVPELTPEVMRMLDAHPFPGNVRELSNLMERATILSCEGWVTPEGLRFDQTGLAGGGTAPDEELPAPPVEVPEPPSEKDVERFIRMLRGVDLNLSSFEERLVREALRRCGGNQVRAAGLLGISRTVLRHRMQLYGLDNSEFRMRGQE